MTEENALVPSDLDLPISNIPRAQLVKMSERSYLPFIKIASTEQDTAVHKPGTWLLCKDATTKQDITSVIEFLVIASRPLACHTTTTGVERYYDMDSKEYAEVERLSQIPNHTGDWHGTDFLLWLERQNAWATWHASSETHRQRAETLIGILTKWEDDRNAKKAAIQKAAQESGPTSDAVKAAQAIIVPSPQAKMGTELVFYKRYNSRKWAAVISPVTTPFSKVPAFDEIRDRSTKFQNPPKSEKEVTSVTPDAPVSTRG